MTSVISHKGVNSARYSTVVDSDAHSYVTSHSTKDGCPEIQISFDDEKSGRTFVITLDADTTKKVVRLSVRGAGYGMEALRTELFG